MPDQMDGEQFVADLETQQAAEENADEEAGLLKKALHPTPQEVDEEADSALPK